MCVGSYVVLRMYVLIVWKFVWCFFFQAEDGIRDLVRSRGLGDVYKRQDQDDETCRHDPRKMARGEIPAH